MKVKGKASIRTPWAQESHLSDYPAVKAFFKLRESGSFAERVTDAVTGSVYHWAGGTCDDGTPAGINVLMEGSGTLFSGPGIENPSGRDFALIVCGEAATGASGTGSLSFYMVGGTKRFRCQPYYGLFGSGVEPSKRIAPAQNQTMNLPLVAGTSYIHAFMKDGHFIRHYGDDGTVNSVDTRLLLQDSGDSTQNANMLALYNNIHGDDTTPINSMTSLGHSGVGDIQNVESGVSVSGGETMPLPHSAVRSGSPDTYEVPSSFPAGTTDEPQLYIGAMLAVFDNGLPDDYAQAISWMKAQWVKKKMLVWPEWVGFR